MYKELEVRAQLYEWNAPGYDGIVYIHPDDYPNALPEDIQVFNLSSRWVVGSACRPEEATTRIKIRVWYDEED